ncbi:DUF1990 family protein [Myxococcus sp. K15C18031901]|uniref:DUF1990 family protein n=1 Tax=Myxococcus dinghuensis TaxID=2906761 RepID=UPI0020A750F8|nr:DUF1990 family protein [Myxococcus dinghuensis]MCP3099169.1 DUF1990 family protein [Myxococcus dinghuensis]
MAHGPRHPAEHVAEGLLLPDMGAGPLLQRDYWGVIRRCRYAPADIMDWVGRHFPEFAPEELCVFAREDASREDQPLEEGETLRVHIHGAGTFGVRVIHKNARSLTLATLPGHPEAGRITFGAYRNVHRDVIFHIRSRARSGSPVHYWGFVTAGEAMQTNTWTEFVTRVAVSAGDGVLGVIHADTSHLDAEPRGGDVEAGPTFLALGSGGDD